MLNHFRTSKDILRLMTSLDISRLKGHVRTFYDVLGYLGPARTS